MKLKNMFLGGGGKWEVEEEAISKGKKILILIRSSNVLK